MYEAVPPCVPAAACLIGRLLGVAILRLRALAGDLQAGLLTALRIIGRASKLGSLEAAVGASIVDPWLIVNPETLPELLRGGTVSSELGPVSFKLGDLPSSLNTAWNGWLSSEYGTATLFNRTALGATATTSSDFECGF